MNQHRSNQSASFNTAAHRRRVRAARRRVAVVRARLSEPTAGSHIHHVTGDLVRGTDGR